MNYLKKTSHRVEDCSGQGFTRARVHVSDRWSLSVITGPCTYGGDQGLYEIAVFKDGKLCYDTPLTDDVVGHCTEEDVLGYIAQLEDYARNEAQA